MGKKLITKHTPKRIAIFTVLTGMLSSACTDNKQQEKLLFNEVIVIHDELMGHEHVLMENKHYLDSLLKLDIPAPVKDSAEMLNKRLTAADDAMSEWMHQFEPDYSEKSHAEAMDYLTKQKAQINKIDSITKAALSQAGKFISNHK